MDQTSRGIIDNLDANGEPAGGELTEAVLQDAFHALKPHRFPHMEWWAWVWDEKQQRHRLRLMVYEGAEE